VTRVLVVEDEESISDPLSYMLRREGFEVNVAATGPDALGLFDRSGADIVLLDLMLPGLSGTEVCRALRQRSGVPIIILTARDSEVDKVVGLELGADDYVTKPFSMKELMARVNAHLRRAELHRQPAGRTPIETDPLRIDPEQVQAYANGQSIGLTPREFEVLYALARSAGKPIPRNRLYREVWGYEMLAGDRSVDVFVRKVRQKLAKALPDHPFIQTHYGVGYRFDLVPETEGDDQDTPAGTDVEASPTP
jgi:two-component system response regulator RegX3